MELVAAIVHVEDIGKKKRSRLSGELPDPMLRRLRREKHNEQETIHRWPELEHD